MAFKVVEPRAKLPVIPTPTHFNSPPLLPSLFPPSNMYPSSSAPPIYLPPPPPLPYLGASPPAPYCPPPPPFYDLTAPSSLPVSPLYDYPPPFASGPFPPPYVPVPQSPLPSPPSPLIHVPLPETNNEKTSMVDLSLIKYYRSKNEKGLDLSDVDYDLQKFICPVITCRKKMTEKQNLSKLTPAERHNLNLELQSHLRRHHQEKLRVVKKVFFQCVVPTCGKRFGSKQSLGVHRQQHLGKDLHQCRVEECGKIFTQMWKLERHLLATHYQGGGGGVVGQGGQGGQEGAPPQQGAIWNYLQQSSVMQKSMESTASGEVDGGVLGPKMLEETNSKKRQIELTSPIDLTSSGPVGVDKLVELPPQPQKRKKLSKLEWQSVLLHTLR